jgi:hypothetical protein
LRGLATTRLLIPLECSLSTSGGKMRQGAIRSLISREGLPDTTRSDATNPAPKVPEGVTQQGSERGH